MAGNSVRTLRIGTRGSPLALAQAELVARMIAEASGGALTGEIVTYTTKGDQLTSERLTEAGGKGLFTREIDRAVDAGEVDIAVHSLKDVPSELPEGQCVLAVPPREDPREAFLSRLASHPRDLPEGAVVGTASLRREAQTLALRPDLTIRTLRGNVQTRISKLEAGEVDATFLALAGLNRLGLAHLASGVIPVEDFLPAPCQGIIAIVAQKGQFDPGLEPVFRAMTHVETLNAMTAERAFLRAMDGSCRTPMAGHLSRDDGGALFRGEWLSDDGRERVCEQERLSGEATPEALAALGDRVARRIRERSGR